MTETLRPCPFCGEHAETDFIPDHGSYRIECSVLNCATGPIRDSEVEAIRDWNDRATPAPAQPDPLHVANERGEGEDAKDAARYRWLKGEGGRIWTSLKTMQAITDDFYDAAVDAAMAAAPKEKP